MNASLYTLPVTSKKGVIGIGVPKHPYDESRRFLIRRPCGFFARARFMAARAGSRKARRFSQGVPGTPTCSSRRHQLALGAVVSANRTLWRPTMAHALSHALTLGNVSVRQHNGLFSLNDLHRASGGERRHRPVEFIRLEQTLGLIGELQKGGDSHLFINTEKGRNGGTYACRELVIAYAAWISAAFHLKVIRVFLANTSPAAERVAQAERAARALLDASAAHPQSDRFLVDLRGHAMPLKPDQLVTSWAQLASDISDPGILLSNAELATLNKACAERMARRLVN